MVIRVFVTTTTTKWCYVIKKNLKANYCYQNEKSEADFHNIFYFIISELINFCLFFISFQGKEF